jgi:ubiquitin-like protein Pup
MSEQTQAQKPEPQKVDEAESQRMAEADAEVQAAQATPGADMTATDELLEEIDSILEENAQEFVANYIQRGGQ